jgi:hypothetical protein
MIITFTRTGERTYTSLVQRDDGVTVSVPGVGQILPIPHDLAHCVIERELNLQNGFWGSVAKGALFPGMALISGRQKPHAALNSKNTLREMGQQGTEAEVLVGVLETIEEQHLDGNWPAASKLLHEMWRPLKPARDLPDAEEVKRTCIALRKAKEQWQSLTDGQSLTIAWPAQGTSKSKKRG